MLRIIVLFLCFICTISQAKLVVTEAEVRLLPPGVPNSAAYFTVQNTGEQPVILVAALADFVQKAEIHNHVHHQGMMKMQQQDEVLIPAGDSVSFAPGGLHIMLFGLKHRLSENQFLTLGLRTKSGQDVTFQATVKRPSAHKHHH